jgi:hypothetical protein
MVTRPGPVEDSLPRCRHRDWVLRAVRKSTQNVKRLIVSAMEWNTVSQESGVICAWRCGRQGANQVLLSRASGRLCTARGKLIFINDG